MLNQSSKEEDEIKILMECDQDMLLDNHTSDIFGIGYIKWILCAKSFILIHIFLGSNSWEESSLSSGISNHHLDLHTSVNDYHRLSNTDSGIVSTRSSSYYSKRSSQQSSVSAQYSSTRPSNENLLDSPTTVIKSISQKSSSSSSTLVVSNSSHSIVSRQGFDTSIDEVPAIPPKNKRKTENRQPSPYDNVPELDHSLGK